MKSNFSHFRNKKATTFITTILVTVIVLAPFMASATGFFKYRRGTIAHLASKINGLQALVGALLYVQEEADLIALLNRKRQRLTVFGPTNAAFELELDLDPGSLDGLTPKQIADALGGLVSVDEVLDILLKHVIVKKVIWENKLLLKGSAVAADGETDLVFSVGQSPEAGNGGVRVNNATIVVSNFWARNGVLHIIDEVIQ